MFEVGTPVLSLQQIPMILLPGKHRRAVREGGDMKAKYHQGAGLGQVEEEEGMSREWVGAGSSRNCLGCASTSCMGECGSSLTGHTFLRAGDSRW